MATNNRFKKSIESATDNTKGNILENKNNNIILNTTDNIIDNTRNNIIDNIKNNITDIAKNNMIDNTINNMKINASSNMNNDILKKILASEKKEKGSNHTLYLSADVGDALNNLAKTSCKSKSALVDEILREILFN